MAQVAAAVPDVRTVAGLDLLTEFPFLFPVADAAGDPQAGEAPGWVLTALCITCMRTDRGSAAYAAFSTQGVLHGLLEDAAVTRVLQRLVREGVTGSNLSEPTRPLTSTGFAKALEAMLKEATQELLDELTLQAGDIRQNEPFDRPAANGLAAAAGPPELSVLRLVMWSHMAAADDVLPLRHLGNLLMLLGDTYTFATRADPTSGCRLQAEAFAGLLNSYTAGSFMGLMPSDAYYARQVPRLMRDCALPPLLRHATLSSESALADLRDGGAWP